MFPVFKDSPPARRQLGPRAWPPQAHWLPHHWTPLQPGACTRLNLQILTAGQRAGGGASAVWILLRNCLVLLAFDVLNFSLKLVMWPRSRTTESDWLRREDWLGLLLPVSSRTGASLLMKPCFTIRWVEDELRCRSTVRIKHKTCKVLKRGLK